MHSVEMQTEESGTRYWTLRKMPSTVSDACTSIIVSCLVITYCDTLEVVIVLRVSMRKRVVTASAGAVGRNFQSHDT